MRIERLSIRVGAVPLLVLVCSPAVVPASAATFLRGDANGDGSLTITDTFLVLSHVFELGESIECEDAGDANDDGDLDVSDAVRILVRLFAASEPLPPPASYCGRDATEDPLDCLGHAACGSNPAWQLDAWLAAHPEVRQNLVWWEAGRGWLSYDSWSEELRGELFSAFEGAWNGVVETIPDVAPNVLEYGDLEWPPTYISSDDARALFLSLVAHSLFVEIRALTAWSIEACGPTALAFLFDGRRLFRSQPYCFPEFSVYPFGEAAPVPPDCRFTGFLLLDGQSLPAPGGKTLRFLEVDVGIGATSRNMIGNLLEWARHGMLHFGGSFRSDVNEYYWGYRGAPSAARIIDGTDPVGFHPMSADWGWPPGTGYDAGFAHWTAGCHGTVAFFRQVLRVVNIAVETTYAAGHALPHFMPDEVYLSHGDDPYNLLSKADYAAGLLLIDAATHQSWFMDPAQARLNVGRQPKVLAATYLPQVLRDYRCQDLAEGRPVESGRVYTVLQPAWSLAELEAMGFWAALDAAITEAGGCDGVP